MGTLTRWFRRWFGRWYYVRKANIEVTIFVFIEVLSTFGVLPRLP